MLGHGERLRCPDEHPFHRFERGRRGNGERDIGRGDRHIRLELCHLGREVDLRLVLELGDLPGHADAIAKIDGVLTAVEHENALRRGRVVIVSTVRLLHVEPAQRGCGALVIADDYALDRGRVRSELTDTRTFEARALHDADGGHRRGSGTHAWTRARGVDRTDGSGERLAGIHSAEGRTSGRPREGAIRGATAGEAERLPDRPRAALDHADVRRCQSVGRTTGRGERTLVAQELLDHATVVDERHTVGCAVLDAVRGIGDRGRPESASLIGEHTGEGIGVIGRPAGAVVQHDGPSGQIGARRTGHLDRLAGVGPGVVVVDLVDEDFSLRRCHRPDGRAGACHDEGRSRQHGSDTKTRGGRCVMSTNVMRSSAIGGFPRL